MANENIKTLLKNNRVKQWEIADRLEISEFTFSRMLRKDLDPSLVKKIEREVDAILADREGVEAFDVE